LDYFERLGILPGVTAVIGSGGKTSLLRLLGGEIAAAGQGVLLCTTTKIVPFPGLPCVTEPGFAPMAAAAKKDRLLCGGRLLENGKLTAPDVPLSDLADMFDYVLVESDGAARRPLKAHKPHEPVIPQESNRVIWVVGASGLGKPILAAAHRPSMYAALAGVSETEVITPEIAAGVLEKENLPGLIFINQAEENTKAAFETAKRLDRPALVGSLLRGEIYFENF
jgi:probable selenium-dependent hydroxylase accessory protein YqeC